MLETRTVYVGSEVVVSKTGQRTEEDGVTCRGEQCTEHGHQPAALVLITKVGGNDAENERTSIRGYLAMTCKYTATARHL